MHSNCVHPMIFLKLQLEGAFFPHQHDQALNCFYVKRNVRHQASCSITSVAKPFKGCLSLFFPLSDNCRCRLAVVDLLGAAASTLASQKCGSSRSVIDACRTAAKISPAGPPQCGGAFSHFSHFYLADRQRRGERDPYGRSHTSPTDLSTWHL